MRFISCLTKLSFQKVRNFDWEMPFKFAPELFDARSLCIVKLWSVLSSSFTSTEGSTQFRFVRAHREVELVSFKSCESSASNNFVVVTGAEHTSHQIKLTANDIIKKSSLKVREWRSAVSTPTLIVRRYLQNEIPSSVGVFDLACIDGISIPWEINATVKFSKCRVCLSAWKSLERSSERVRTFSAWVFLPVKASCA